MSKKITFISLAVIILIIIFILRSLSLEDNWVCQDGSWIKHGNPKQEKPSTLCPNSNPTGENKACTLDAKICPDGSYVGRSGPNCDFVSCPE